MYFSYGKTEVEYLKSRDKILGEIIDQIGPVERKVDTDLFSSVVHHIIVRGKVILQPQGKEFFT